MSLNVGHSVAHSVEFTLITLQPRKRILAFLISVIDFRVEYSEEGIECHIIDYNKSIFIKKSRF